MTLDAEETRILSLAINELTSSLDIRDLEIKTGRTIDVQILKRKLDTNRQDHWSCDELKLQRNILAELLKELDSFEFSTRLGYSEDEVWTLLKKIKILVDDVCYPRAM